MPTPVYIVRLNVVRFGEPDHGVWCDGCLLPSAVAQSFAAVSGLSVCGIFRVTVCEDCGRFSTVKVHEGAA